MGGAAHRVGTKKLETCVLWNILSASLGYAMETSRAKWTDDHIDARFDEIDKRFDRVDARFDRLESRFESRFDKLDSRFDRLQIGMIVTLASLVATVAASHL